LRANGFRELFSATQLDIKVASGGASPDESSGIIRSSKLIRGGMEEERSLRGNPGSFSPVREVKLKFAFNIGRQRQAINPPPRRARLLELKSRRYR